MEYAPIALFTYNRADKTQRVLESLMQNAEAKDSDLFIFSDGPKNEKAVDGVKANREFLHKFKASGLQFKSITIIEREKNWGLANSLIAGITEVINKYGRVIVVEDDLILSPYFLKFMNDGLEMYKDEDKVSSITAFVPDVKEELPETYFLSFFHCWGWATWKRAWDLLETDPRPLLKKIKWKKNKFNVGGSFGNYGLLYLQKVGGVDSWYIRLYASFFLAEKLTLFPKHSLITNGGMDGSGTHSKNSKTSPFCVEYYNYPIDVARINIEENTEVFRIFSKTLARNRKKTLKTYWIDFKSVIRRLLDIDAR